MNDKRQTVIAAAGHRGNAPAADSPAQSHPAHSLSAGSRVAYLPYEGGDDWNFPYLEHGWITSIDGDAAFCKFYYPGTRILKTLRPVRVPLSRLRRRVGWKVKG